MRLAMAAVLTFTMSSAGAAGFVAFRSAGDADTAAIGADSIATTSGADRDTTGAMQQSSSAAERDEPNATPPVGDVDTTQHADDPDTVAVDPAAAQAETQAERTLTPVESPVRSPPLPVVNADSAEQQRQAYRQVARILSNMRENDVAQILAHIQDADVEGILRQLTARDAAKLLSELPAERAARLSKRLLRSVPQEGGTR